MQDLYRRYGHALTFAIIAITAFWLLVLVLLPNFTMLESSFRPYLAKVDEGGPLDTYSMGNTHTLSHTISISCILVR